MAYLAFQDLGGGSLLEVEAPLFKAPPAAVGLNPLEWAVVALARGDGRGSLRPAGRWERTVRKLLQRPNPRLADPKLEALRRMAVLSWQDGYTVAGREVRAFLAAGYTTDQYEALVDHTSAARVLPPRTVTSG